MPMTDDLAWLDDPIFSREAGRAGEHVSPAFRITVHVPYERGYHGLHPEAYADLFETFRPLIAEHCDRIKVCTKPGGKWRRNMSIGRDDWAPFTQLLRAHDDIGTGSFVAFQFIDRDDDQNDFGRGPTRFEFYVGKTILLDMCIPVHDFAAGRLDLAAVLDALQRLPYLSFNAGYGLAMSSRACNGPYPPTYDVALRYPALDVIDPKTPGWYRNDPIEEPGICGIAWLTGIGEPFRSRLGGATGLRAVLPPAIAVQDGPNGVILQLGARPITGQRGIDDADLPLYHATGDALRHVWMPDKTNRPDQSFEPLYNDLSLSLPWHQRFYRPGFPF